MEGCLKFILCLIGLLILIPLLVLLVIAVIPFITCMFTGYGLWITICVIITIACLIYIIKD